MILAKLKEFFKIDDDYKKTILSLILTAIICFVSYNAFIVYGFNSPDGVLEGLYYYVNRHWAISGCGRWFLALINNAHANIVAPWLTIIECCIANWLSSFVLCKILGIKNKYHISLLCVLFSVIPTFIEINLYTNSAFSFSISILLSILYVYFNLKDSYLYSIISAICLGFAMGSYQSQIGIAVGLTVICLIKKILEGNSDTIKYFIRSLISGVLGIIVYVVGLNICLAVYHLELSSRAASFSLGEMLKNLPSSFIKMYSVFFNTFNQNILKRNYVYLILLVILIIEIMMIVIDIIRNKKYIKLLSILLICVLPAAFNIIGVILPMFDVTALMLTPNYLMLFFVIYLLNYINGKTEKVISFVVCIFIAILSWTYVLSANATYESYRLSYSSYKAQFANALDKVYELDDYEYNSTKIVVVGTPSDAGVRENVRTYNYAINLYPNLLYWKSTDLDINSTYYYLINEFGVNPGQMEYEEYKEIIANPSISSMPVWPSKGSVQLINGYAVIKFGEPNE